MKKEKLSKRLSELKKSVAIMLHSSHHLSIDDISRILVWDKSQVSRAINEYKKGVVDKLH